MHLKDSVIYKDGGKTKQKKGLGMAISYTDGCSGYNNTKNQDILEWKERQSL
jgi:hypothetical protein